MDVGPSTSPIASSYAMGDGSAFTPGCAPTRSPGKALLRRAHPPGAAPTDHPRGGPPFRSRTVPGDGAQPG